MREGGWGVLGATQQQQRELEELGRPKASLALLWQVQAAVQAVPALRRDAVVSPAAVLPPPPVAILPVAFVVVPVVYALPALRIISPPAFVFARPRAPPVTV